MEAWKDGWAGETPRHQAPWWGREGPSSGQPQGPLQHTLPPQRWFSYKSFWPVWVHGGLGLEWGWDGAGLSLSPQAEEDKEEQTDSQPDASSSQTVTPVAEPPSTEPAPPNGPASLGPLDLLPSEEVLTDTSNSSSSTGEEGEGVAPSSPWVTRDQPHSGWR